MKSDGAREVEFFETSISTPCLAEHGTELVRPDDIPVFARFGNRVSPQFHAAFLARVNLLSVPDERHHHAPSGYALGESNERSRLRDCLRVVMFRTDLC